MNRPATRLTGFLFLLALAACQGAPEPQTAELEVPEIPEPIPDEVRGEVEARGAAAAGALAQGLMVRLAAAMDEEGVAGAVDFCSDEALLLTDQVSEAHDPSLELKRTTARWRNPANAPDPSEARVLAYLQSLEVEEPGSAPESFTAIGPEGTFHFYRILRTAPMCLNCHGDEGALLPEVRNVLRERYPEDRATGYTEGEFRGVIRVRFPANSGVAP